MESAGGKERKRKRNSQRAGGDLGKVGQWVSRPGYHCFLLSVLILLVECRA